MLLTHCSDASFHGISTRFFAGKALANFFMETHFKGYSLTVLTHLLMESALDSLLKNLPPTFFGKPVSTTGFITKLLQQFSLVRYIYLSGNYQSQLYNKYPVFFQLALYISTNNAIL